MDKIQLQIKAMGEQIQKLQTGLDELSASYYKNNFSSSQTFNKDIIFQSRLKVPHYTSAPAVCEVGDIIEIGGKLYICTVANTTFTLVGTQS